MVDAEPTRKILTGWIVKEELRRLLACGRTGAHRREILARLHRFDTWYADSRLPGLERLAGAIEAWWSAVLGSLQTGSPGPAPRPPTGR